MATDTKQTRTAREELAYIERSLFRSAGLCHDLSLHFMFDLKEAFGVRNDFWVSNKREQSPRPKEVLEIPR